MSASISPCDNCSYALRVVGRDGFDGRIACTSAPFQSHEQRIVMARTLRIQRPNGIDHGLFRIQARGIGTLHSAWPVRFFPRHVEHCEQQALRPGTPQEPPICTPDNRVLKGNECVPKT